MSAFAIGLLCIQACLVQNAFSLGAYGYAPYGCGTTLTSPIGCGTTLASPIGCGASIGPYGAAPYNNMYPYNNYIDSYGCAPYGGAGAGNVAVAGELPVGGTTFVAGQVPIIGGVEFGGAVPAAGAVTITGACACGCGPYGY